MRIPLPALGAGLLAASAFMTGLALGAAPVEPIIGAARALAEGAAAAPGGRDWAAAARSLAAAAAEADLPSPGWALPFFLLAGAGVVFGYERPLARLEADDPGPPAGFPSVRRVGWRLAVARARAEAAVSAPPPVREVPPTGTARESGADRTAASSAVHGHSAAVSAPEAEDLEPEHEAGDPTVPVPAVGALDLTAPVSLPVARAGDGPEIRTVVDPLPEAEDAPRSPWVVPVTEPEVRPRPDTEAPPDPANAAAATDTEDLPDLVDAPTAAPAADPGLSVLRDRLESVLEAVEGMDAAADEPWEQARTSARALLSIARGVRTRAAGIASEVGEALTHAADAARPSAGRPANRAATALSTAVLELERARALLDEVASEAEAASSCLERAARQRGRGLQPSVRHAVARARAALAEATAPAP